MDPFLGEIRCFSFGRIPRGWLPCNGQTLDIQHNQALYALIGIRFGGNGTTNFKLPNLNGVVPMHFNLTQTAPNAETDIGGAGGSETVTLNLTQIPAHNHLVRVSTTTANQPSPAGHFPAALPSPHLAFAAATNPQVHMLGSGMGVAGEGQAHSNMQPYLVVNFCIAIQGTWPSRPD